MRTILRSKNQHPLGPIRQIIRHFNKIRIFITCILPLLRNPRKIRPTLIRLFSAWNRSGLLAVKQLLLQLPNEVSFRDIWLQYQKSITPDVVADIRHSIRRMQQRPRISILMPVFNMPSENLRHTIDSVLAQHYSAWELCVFVSDSLQDQSYRTLLKYAARDNRIRVEFSEIIVDIAQVTNGALAMATGSFVVLLGQDVLLEKQALFRLAESILGDDADMIYSDEVIMSKDGGEVTEAIYRPSFSLEMLRSYSYITNFVAFKTTLLREIGGMDTSLMTCHDYDLILRASEKAQIIVHIPEVLYLSRHRTDSTRHAMQGALMETCRHVLTKHLERCCERGDVKDGPLLNFYEVRYPIEPGQHVAIIIPTKNHWELVQQCVDSIERTVTEVSYDIFVIDHASTDPESLAYFQKLNERHRVLRYEGPFNFSAINNWAVNQLEAAYTHYLFCNNDIEATESCWLERMVELCQKLDVGMVGAKLFYPGGKIFQHAGVCVGMFGIAEHYAKFMDERLPDGSIDPGYHGTLITNHEVSAITAACALMRRDAFERIGGFDEELAVGFGDVDLCIRTSEAGYRVVFCPHAVLIHHESYTRGKGDQDPHPEDSALFVKKWSKFLEQGDPYYNPNLAVHSTRWDINLPMQFIFNIRRRVTNRYSILNFRNNYAQL